LRPFHTITQVKSVISFLIKRNRTRTRWCDFVVLN